MDGARIREGVRKKRSPPLDPLRPPLGLILDSRTRKGIDGGVPAALFPPHRDRTAACRPAPFHSPGAALSAAVVLEIQVDFAFDQPQSRAGDGSGPIDGFVLRPVRGIERPPMSPAKPLRSRLLQLFSEISLPSLVRLIDPQCALELTGPARYTVRPQTLSSTPNPAGELVWPQRRNNIAGVGARVGAVPNLPGIRGALHPPHWRA